MGLFRSLALLPLAPLEGVVWVADKLAQEADRQLAEELSPRTELAQAADAYDRGEIDAETYDAIEELLLRQMPQSVTRLDQESAR